MRNGVIALLLLAAGCGKSPPSAADGKPLAHWLEALRHDPDSKSRKKAAFKLGNAGPANPAVLPALIEALKDRNALVRGEAVLALVKFGKDAREASPALAELRERDRDPKVRNYAMKALEKLGI